MIVRDILTWFLGASGLSELARMGLVKNGRFALNFHGVSRQRYANVPRSIQPHHTIAEFRQILNWLSTRFDFLSFDEFLYTANPGVFLTFDDGHANNLTNILPVLAEFRAQGLFFVSVQHVRNPRDWLGFARTYARQGWGNEAAVPEDFAVDCYDGLSETQLIELARSPWAVIGSHTLSHPSLPSCSPENLRVELYESRQYLQRIAGQPVNSLAYPYGHYNRSVAEAAREAGYSAAFAVDPLPVGLSNFEIPRIGIYAADFPYLAVKTSGLHRRATRGPEVR